MSAFVLDDGVVYHAYPACARGLDGPWACASRSTVSLGRNENGMWTGTSRRQLPESRDARMIAATVA